MLLAIDPGVNNCGIAVADTSGIFKVVETQNVKNARKFTDVEKLVEAEYGARVVKVQHITDSVSLTLDKYPDVREVSIETPPVSLASQSHHEKPPEVTSGGFSWWL